MGVGLRLTVIMLAVAGAVGCGGATATHEASSGRSAAPVTHRQSQARPKLVYQLSVHYTFAAGADRVTRTFFGGPDVEWVNPASGAFDVHRRISRDVSDGRREVTSSIAFGWDGPDTRIRTARFGSPEFIASQANVFSLVYLRAYLGQPTSVDVAGQIHRTTADGRPAFTVTGGIGKGVAVTFTILHTITPADAASRGLFTVQTHGVQITQRELSPGAHPSTVPAYWFGSSIDGLSLQEEYEETTSTTRTDTVFFQYHGSDALRPQHRARGERCLTRRYLWSLSASHAGKLLRHQTSRRLQRHDRICRTPFACQLSDTAGSHDHVDQRRRDPRDPQNHVRHGRRRPGVSARSSLAPCRQDRRFAGSV